MTIEITTWGHSAVRFERDGRRLVIDPGGYSDLAVISSVEAVLITHEHPDHFALDAVSEALAANPELEVWGPAPVVGQLRDAGAPQDRVHQSRAGAGFDAAGFAVLGVGGQHALIHRAIPRIENVGYLIEESTLHPGDSLCPAPDGVSVDTLLLPISAPWLKIAESVDYLAEIAPTRAVPIHDAILSDAGRAICDRVVQELSEGVDYHRVAAGESLSL